MILDDDLPENGVDVQPQDAARERIRGLEEQVELLKTLLEAERERNADLMNEVKDKKFHSRSQRRQHTWWRFWKW